MRCVSFADKIVPGLYLGDLRSLSFLLSADPKERKKWCVISVLHKEDLERFQMKLLPCRILVDVKDDSETNLYSHFKTMYNFIFSSLNSGKNVLVHCKSGISRGPATIMVYLVKRYNMTPKKALEFVKEKRPIVEPKSGFLKQLSRLYSENKNQK